MVKQVFEPVRFGNLQIKNRIIRSATLERGGAENGEITPLLKTIYTDLARYDVGLIITGMMGVGYNSCAFSGMAKIYDKTFIEHFSSITNAVHENGGKIAVQLGHCGAKSNVLETVEYPYSPSDFEIGAGKIAKEMTSAEIKKVTEDFGLSAEICRESGADCVEIHAAHGYLLSQFLSPYYNKRKDCYGGNLDNRARIVLETYKSVRAHVGEDYPVLIKLNYSDLIEGGMNGSDCVYICKKLESLGIDGIEISSGLAVNQSSLPFQKPSENETGTFTDGALDVSENVSIPVISVGGYRSLSEIQTVLNEGKISAVSMSRPFICEPELVSKWLKGDSISSKCISCNQCFGSSFSCVQYR